MKNAVCDLANKECVPCKGGVPPLKGQELKDFMHQLGNQWQLVREHHIEKVFAFTSYLEAVAFTNRLAALAEQQGHHPDILLTYDKVMVTLWTHKIDGLAESDFIFAAKADTLR